MGVMQIWLLALSVLALIVAWAEIRRLTRALTRAEGEAAIWEAVALAAERLARAERDAAPRHLRRRREKRAAAAPASAGSGAPPREGEP